MLWIVSKWTTTLSDCRVRITSGFKNHCRKERVPFVIYADLECILEKTEMEETSKYQYYRVFSIAYYVYCSYDASLYMYRFRRDKDCVAWFAEELRILAHNVESILSSNDPMEFTRDNLEKFNNATHCHVCEKPFAPNDMRVRDHCRAMITGRFRGSAHSNCNLNYKDSHCIPIVFYNLSGYRAHFIIKEITTAYDGRVELLPITKEKYLIHEKC